MTDDDRTRTRPSSARRARGAVAVLATGALGLGALGLGATHVADADSSTSVASNLVPLAPARILDTRSGVGVPAGVIAPGQTVTLQVAGAGGVPAAATAVVINVTVTQADANGYLTVSPGGEPRPDASAINYTTGEDVANMLTVQLSSAGTLDIYNAQGNAHVLADVAGYLTPVAPAAVAPDGPVLIDLTSPFTVATPVGVFGGVRVTAQCASNYTFLQIDTPSGNDLQLGGIGYAGTTVQTYDVVSGSAGTTLVKSNPSGPLQFSGMVEHASIGEPYQLELHVSPVNPCRVWGSATPL